VIYTCGVIGLMIVADLGFVSAFELGVSPFLVGDILKGAAAGILLPGAWRLIGE
jgi:biotin transport system substrate-specific component